MKKLHLVPESDGYSSTDGTEVIATALDGGPSRYRRDKIGAPKSVNVKWTLNPVQYRYWRAFYVTATQKGTLPFLCDLLSEDGTGPVEQVCSFVPGSVTLPAQQGLSYVQQAVLEVKPLPHDETLDNMMIDLYSVAGDESEAVVRALAVLVNVTAPTSLDA